MAEEQEPYVSQPLARLLALAGHTLTRLCGFGLDWRFPGRFDDAGYIDCLGPLSPWEEVPYFLRGDVLAGIEEKVRLG